MEVPVILVTVAVIWLPGFVLWRLLRLATTDWMSRFARQIALGLSIWPVAFLFSGLADLRWTATSIRIAIASLAIGAGIFAWRSIRLTRIDLMAFTTIGVLALVAFTRVRHVRGIDYPLWVDSVHHTMIIRLIVERGTLPESYHPFIPHSSFYYHWGFHCVASVVAWVSGITAPDLLPRLLLVVGQVLNALVFAAVWCGAKSALQSRHAALFAAILATLVSWFPAYYVSWGRYTQLTGLLLLPPLAAAFWELKRRPNLRRATEVGLVSAGLLLIHVRVAMVFALLALLIFLLPARRTMRALGWCAAATAIGLALAGPWMIHLAGTAEVRSILSPAGPETARWEMLNAVPADLLWAPHNLTLFTVASAGLIGLTPLPLSAVARIASIAVWLVLVILLFRRRAEGVSRHEAWRLGVLAAWVLLITAVVNADRLALPRLRALTNSSAVIMLFLPVSLAAAEVLRRTISAAVPTSRRRAVTLGAAAMISITGAMTMREIVNPNTVLTTRADVDALRWIRLNIPANARFSVGVQQWIGGSYVGVDGGYWVRVAADRESVLPPGLYPWVMPSERVDDLTEALQSGKHEGVTHAYIGPRNPNRAAPPSSERIYAQDGVEIYALRRAD